MTRTEANAAAYYGRRQVALRAAGQLLYPRRCPLCRRVLGFVAECPDCAAVADALERHPSKRLYAETHYLGDLDGAAAAFRYEGEVRAAILRAKYSGEAWAAEELGCMAAKRLFGSAFSCRWGVPVPQEAQGVGLGYDVVVPVPSSGKARGYNVPHRIALPIAKAIERPLAPAALRRVRFDRHQAGLALEERLVNVAGAFRAADRAAVEGRRVLLVDDILTTGATAAACAQALLEAGAESVFAVAVASADKNFEKPERKAQNSP
jgi:predicted amidophosphoribosyltransferase